MKRIVCLCSILVFVAVHEVQAAVDLLAKQRLDFRGENPTQIFETTTGDLRAIFEQFQIALDSESKLVSPLQIGGTQSNPTVKVRVQKCKFFICQTVSLDGEVSLSQTSGSCQKNMKLEMDLARSSRELTEIYDKFVVSICFNSKDQVGELFLVAEANQAPTFSRGFVQREIFKMLQLQTKPIISALQKTLRASGAL